MVTARTLTQRHRAQQLLIRKDVTANFAKVWPLLDATRLDATFPEFADATSALVKRYRTMSANTSASYVRQVRALKVKGRPTLEVASALDSDQFVATLQSTSVAAVKKATGNGAALEQAMQIGLTKATGAMVRLSLNGGRETVTGSVRADKAGRGWARVLGGSGCDFCRDLAGRGFVYGEDSVDFEAHGNCACSAEPQYG